MHAQSKTRIAFIGFGEVGRRFAADLLRGAAEIPAYDIVLDDEAKRGERLAVAEPIGVRPAGSAMAAADGADFIIPAVTASDAEAVARGAAGYWIAAAGRMATTKG